MRLRITDFRLRLKKSKRKLSLRAAAKQSPRFYHDLGDCFTSFAKTKLLFRSIFIIIFFSFFIFHFSFSQQLGGHSGAFARMGFGARGMGMGNSLTAVTNGEVTTYYNPAISPFAKEKTFSASYSLLSLDRSINFLNFTQSIAPTAGFSLGIINQRVSNIDGRDADGVHTENYSTTENQFYFSFANQLSKKISIGLNAKIYYAKLFEKFSTTTVGFDAGVLLRPIEKLSLGIVLQDFNSKYRWNSKDLYQENGGEVVDTFPSMWKFAAAYSLPSNYGIISAELETSNKHTTLLRAGIELNLEEHFTVRAGIDRYNLKDKYAGAKPTFGFSVKRTLFDLKTNFHYAYIHEPFSPSSAHILSLSFSLY